MKYIYKDPSERTPDYQYHNLLKDIYDNGRDVMPIHGESSRKLTGAQLKFPFENGFPLLTERDLSGKFFEGALGEHIGFLNGAHTHEELSKFGCPWWNRWVTKEKCEIFGLEEGDLGPGSYGAAWANFPTSEGKSVNQIEVVVQQIKEMPFLRTHLISPWIPQYTLQGSLNKRKVVVAPCHGWIHIHVYPEQKELEIVHWQRSADVPVGLAFNIIQYAAFGMMLSHVTGYTMIGLTHQISDPHMYESQYEKVEELLKREPRKFPTIKFDEEKVEEEVKTIFDFRPHHFVIEDYEPHEKMLIPTPV